MLSAGLNGTSARSPEPSEGDRLRSGLSPTPSTRPWRRSHPDCRCAGETGEKQPVQARHDEAVAIRIDPEPCAVFREEDGEASVGACTGQPSSREDWVSLGADAFDNAEGDTDGLRHREHPSDPAWSETPACAEAFRTGTGRSRVRPAADMGATVARDLTRTQAAWARVCRADTTQVGITLSRP